MILREVGLGTESLQLLARTGVAGENTETKKQKIKIFSRRDIENIIANLWGFGNFELKQVETGNKIEQFKDKPNS